MNAEDPFLLAEADATSLLSTARSLGTSYRRIRSTARTRTSPELLEAGRELLSTLDDLTSDLQDLADAVAAVEGDPYKYGLEVGEVARRRKLVKDVGEEVRQIRSIIDAAGHGSTHLPDPNAFEVDGDGDGEGGDDDAYAEFEQQQQQEIMQEQDVALDGVFKTVGNLRQQADDMGRELEEQGELLDTVDTITDRVGGKLNQGMKKVAWVIRKNEDSMSSCCIAVLIFVLILLLFLVIVL